MPALPASLAKLFDPSDFEALCPYWVSTFAARKQFRLRGYNEFTRDRMLPRLAKSEVAELVSLAREAIPVTWKNQWPSGDWDSLRYEQYAFAREAPLRFDKACLVIAITAVQMEKQDIKEPLWENIKICPAVFSVNGFDKNVYATHVRNDPDLYKSLAIASGGQNGSFFGEILGGHLMSQQTAEGIAKIIALKNPDAGVCAFRHTDPHKNRRTPTPAASERINSPARI
jgi:hypothetical protein